jgi:hypothetical protein
MQPNKTYITIEVWTLWCQNIATFGTFQPYDNWQYQTFVAKIWNAQECNFDWATFVIKSSYWEFAVELTILIKITKGQITNLNMRDME